MSDNGTGITCSCCGEWIPYGDELVDEDGDEWCRHCWDDCGGDDIEDLEPPYQDDFTGHDDVLW
jgi:hypothetical protein